MGPMDTDNFISDFTERLKSSGYTQSQLAQFSGLSQGAINKVYNMRRHPKISTVIKLWPYAYGTDFPRIPARPDPAEGE